MARVGVIGLGRAGVYFHCRPLALNPDFEIAGVFDSRPQLAQEVAKTYGCESFLTADDLINSPEVDLVVVAAPTVWHHSLAMQAIRAGKSVLVEKPFACSELEAAELFEAGEREGVFIGAFHNRRFDPDVRTLRRILNSGELGEVMKVSIHLHAFARRKDWQTWRSKGGGALANWGAHALDWCIHLFGHELKYLHSTLFQVLNPGDAEDSFHTLLQTPSGLLIQIEYMNFVACPLPRWHVLGRYGTAVSKDKTFVLRTCNPKLLQPLRAETQDASDGTYAVEEDLQWSERVEPWDHWDNAPPFYEALSAHLKGEGPIPAPASEVLCQLRLIEQIREVKIQRPHSFGSVSHVNGTHLSV